MITFCYLAGNDRRQRAIREMLENEINFVPEICVW